MAAPTVEKRDLSQQHVVDAIETRETRYSVWDSISPGFGLKVWPSGARSWLYQYVTHARVLRKMTLGDARVMTFDEAHAQYVAHAYTVKHGADPMALRTKTRKTAVEKRDLSQQRIVNAIRSQVTRYFVWDTVREGLGLNVFPNGHRRWVYSYVTKERKQRQMIIGDANVMTCAEASAQWTARRHELQQGADPFALAKLKCKKTAERPAWAAQRMSFDMLQTHYRALLAENARLNEALHHQLQRNYALEHLSHPATT